MAPAPVRRSDRVSLTLLLEVSGRDSLGQEFKLPARTVLINRNGAVIVLDRNLTAGQHVHVQRRAPNEAHRSSDVRVVGQFGRQRDGLLYGIEIPDSSVDLWGVEFPQVAESLEAVARMLVECTYCHTREVAHLNEMELRAFETNRGIARHCKACGIPTIWIQTLHEDEKKMGRASRSRRGSEAQGVPPGDGEQRERKRLRLKTRLTACIRMAGADDELAVCEDISSVGMGFRSKRRYETGTSVEVAVPYSPDAANIFLPARVVYSEAMPKAGLFRHGTEYRRMNPLAR